MRVALAQINTTVGDIWGNVEKMADTLERATDSGAELVAYPELTIPGYPPEDLLMRQSFIEENTRALHEFAALVPENLVAAAGFVDLGADLYNACALVSGGEVLHRYHKRYLPNYGVFDENRYFREGSGAPILDLGDALVGVSVCEDIWYPGGPAREQALGGASVLLNISASPYHRQKGAARERMLGVRASDYGCYVLFCNLTGGQDELVFDGHSVVFDPEGRLVARAGQFREDLLIVDLYPDHSLMQRLHDPRPRKENAEHKPEVVRVPRHEMPVANKFGWIVLSTGNKSEMSVGYSTLYGDSAGGFAVIKDVPKNLVYRVARHFNERKKREIIPDSVLNKEPTAELREDQRDTDSLPPYEVLDPILEAYIEEDRGVAEIVASGFEEDDVRRIVQLVDRAEYKRRQAPTGIKVTGRAFGRDRRMPITNRYFERNHKE